MVSPSQSTFDIWCAVDHTQCVDKVFMFVFFKVAHIRRLFSALSPCVFILQCV